MKKFLQIGLVMLVLLSSATVFADESDFTLKINNENQKFIRFSFYKAEDVHLTLFTFDEEVLYEEDIHADGASSKVYDLNALPDGDYMLKVSSDTKLAKYKLVIENGTAIVSEPSIVNAIKPALIRVDNDIVLSLDNLEGAPIEVEVFNDMDESLYKEVFVKKSKFQKKFNVSRTDLQTLTFVVKVKDQKFVKTMDLF